ncbi:MAG: sugar phosphate isomerase/epimerase family protein, partial [Chloroflexota bacterium]
MKLAISSYSFHRLGSGPETGQPKPDLGDVIDRAAALGCDGVELLGVHFPSTERDNLNGLKRRALQAGVQIVAVSAHHNFVKPDREERRQQVAVVHRWIDVAASLGAPVVRVFGGRWQTAPSFAAYMANRGQEPALPGYTQDDAFGWIVEGFTAALERAESAGVVLALENHWGFTGTAAGTLRIIRSLASPWLAAVLDTGNFLE